MLIFRGLSYIELTLTYLLPKKLSSFYHQGEALDDFKIYLKGRIPTLHQLLNASPMDKSYLKEMQDFLPYISHDDIVELVKDINNHSSDFTYIKNQLDKTLSKQIKTLPQQHFTLIEKIVELFGLLVKNSETRVKTSFSVAIISPNKSTSIHGDKQIPPLNAISKIALNEWLEEIKFKPQYTISSFLENFKREYKNSCSCSSSPLFFFSELQDSEILENKLFEEYKTTDTKASLLLYLDQYLSEQDTKKWFDEKENDSIEKSFNTLVYETRFHEIERMFYKEISTRNLSKDFYCPNIVETPTYKTLNEIKDLFENFYTCVEANNEISPIDVAKRIITKLEAFEDYKFRIDIIKVLLDKSPTDILDIICRLGYKDKKDVDNIKNLWFAKQTSFNAHLEEEIKRLSSKTESQSVARPLLSLSTFSRSFTEEEQDSLYNGLIEHDFIAKDTKREHFNSLFRSSTDDQQCEDTFERIKWIKPTERVKSSTSRSSFYNFLNLLKISHAEISDTKFLNSLFVMKTGKRLTVNNKNDAQKTNFISEYNNLLTEIINESITIK